MRAIVLMGLALAFLTGCAQVENQERAVFFKKGVLYQECYGAGWHNYEPFTTNMDIIDVGIQKAEFKDLSAGTYDLQEVLVDLVVTYSVDPTNCHKLFEPGKPGHNYEQSIVLPRTWDVVKEVGGTFAFSQMIKERGRLGDRIAATLKGELARHNLILDGVAVADITPTSKEFIEAISRKQVEEQAAQQAQFVLQRKQKEAEARIAEAEGQSKANKLLAESLRQSPETIRFKELEMMEKKWDGKLPQFITGNGGTLVSVPVPR